MRKTLLIIPGFKESTDEAPYQELLRRNENEYTIITHTPHWNNQTATDWVTDLKVILRTIDVDHTTVVSFSLGAYITLILAESYPFQKIILCSLSPFFKEHLPMIPPQAEKVLGVTRMKDFATHKIPANLKCPSVFLFGENEWPIAIKEAKRLTKRYNGEFTLVSNTLHELTDEYINVISRYTKENKL